MNSTLETSYLGVIEWVQQSTDEQYAAQVPFPSSLHAESTDPVQLERTLRRLMASASSADDAKGCEAIANWLQIAPAIVTSKKQLSQLIEIARVADAHLQLRPPLRQLTLQIAWKCGDKAICAELVNELFEDPGALQYRLAPLVSLILSDFPSLPDRMSSASISAAQEMVTQLPDESWRREYLSLLQRASTES